MKKYILLLLFVFSCSSISDKVTIDAKDYRRINKETEYDYLYSNLEKSDFYYDREFFKILNEMQDEFESYVKVKEIYTLPGLILKRLNVSKENLKKMYNLEKINPLVYNYLSLLELKREDFTNAYNNAWISKTAEHNYLSDEIFMYINIVFDEKEMFEEVLVNMENIYKDYPLNKYNRLLYDLLYNFSKVSEEDFKNTRKEIRKINKNFYPELQGYVIELLMMLDLLQSEYYFSKKDVASLIKLRDEINKTEIKDKIDLGKINNNLDYYIKKLLEE
ncbi:hypothetical protein HP397_00560 [Streptobacillus felis]|uniref:Uncharacterized protein n=2 Tax=Streptobacillus felis TaxID=1384509 RepID=A0A7Z0T7Y4_9FUSO|nr:hypothetical protein [Streptobacillus felis]NYV27319.1 hypothetical protein [Streptobacillus felis]